MAEPKEFTVVSSAEDLRYAARSGDIDEAEQILNRYKGESNTLSKLLPAVLSATDDLSGNTALHLCCANGHLDIVRLLLSHHAPPDATNLSGSTALHYAALTGQLEIVKELIAHNAKPVAENKFGRTALDEAHTGKQAKVAEFLLSHVESTGTTPDLDKEDASEAQNVVEELSAREGGSS